MTLAPADDDLLAAARRALRSPEGGDALAALGWWDLLDELDDRAARAALVALFRAQGLEPAATPALGALMAEPYLGATGLRRGSVVAAVPRRSARRGWVPLVVGDVTAVEHLVVDVPGAPVVVVELADVELRPVVVPGRLPLAEVDLDGCRRVVDATDLGSAGRRSRALGRIACAHEILGAAEGALARAVEHARVRTQFGQPIGAFQAVRHLLAWSVVDCAAIQAVGARAVELDGAAPARFDEVTKALAGRDGRRVCERSLQVLGAVGFTAELDHHHLHGRVLALDAVLGSAATTTRELGASLRAGTGDPGIPAALLAALLVARPTDGGGTDRIGG